MLIAAPLFFSVLTGLAAAEPQILHTWTLPMWGASPSNLQWGPTTEVVLWPVACERPAPRVEFTRTFADDDVGAQTCVPARLRLPDSVMSPLGNETASSTLSRLERCFKTTTKKAPTDIVTGLTTGELDPTAVLAAQTVPTILVVARREEQEGGEPYFDVQLLTSTGEMPPLPDNVGGLRLSLVSAPHAKEVRGLIRHKAYNKAVRVARRAYERASPSDRLRAAGNLAVAAVLAGNKAAVPQQAATGPTSDDDASYESFDALVQAQSWARGELEVGGDPCRVSAPLVN